MATLTLNGKQYANMIINGAANLGANKKEVNDLNVFPIPDGDTGDNMFMTIDAGSNDLNGKDIKSLEDAAGFASKGMLLGARGNSGVILSRIFAGISIGLKDVVEADVPTFHEALKQGVEESYKAVLVPVEGTILTVFKDSVNYAGSNISKDSTFETYFNDLYEESKKSLDRTPDLLDVLKEAGVVDSGGAGLIYIIDGMKKALEGIVLVQDNRGLFSANKMIDVSLFSENDTMKYGYCTEFLLRLQTSKVDINAFNLDVIKNYLSSIGDSLVAVQDGTIVKIHVHTFEPGKVFNFCQQFGEFLTVKVENMTIQHSESELQEKQKSVVTKKKRHKKNAIVTVAAGKGIKDTFSDLGCDYVVDGGQSMNPSAEDFIEAFETINAENIYVFPNNGNIILTAEQAALLYKDSNVYIVPTKTIGEGYSAISQIDFSSNNPEEVIEGCKELIEDVVTGIVSKASKNTQKDGVEVKCNDYIGFSDDVIYCDKESAHEAAMCLASNLKVGNYDILLLIQGESVTNEEANEVVKELKALYRNTEIILINGEQPIYDYILVLE